CKARSAEERRGLRRTLPVSVCQPRRAARARAARNGSRQAPVARQRAPSSRTPCTGARRVPHAAGAAGVSAARTLGRRPMSVQHYSSVVIDTRPLRQILLERAVRPGTLLLTALG